MYFIVWMLIFTIIPAFLVPSISGTFDEKIKNYGEMVGVTVVTSLACGFAGTFVGSSNKELLSEAL